MTTLHIGIQTNGNTPCTRLVDWIIALPRPFLFFLHQTPKELKDPKAQSTVDEGNQLNEEKHCSTTVFSVFCYGTDCGTKLADTFLFLGIY